MNVRKSVITALLLSVLLLPLGAQSSLAQEPRAEGDLSAQALVGTAFTYQGQLILDDTPVDDTCDLQFGLWDAVTAGAQVGTTQSKMGVSIADGYFTAQLNFGADAFQGDARWLEVTVRCPASTGSYVLLTPRQTLTPVPYALAALSVKPHDHLDQTWIGSDPLVITGTFGAPGYAALVLDNSAVVGDGLRVSTAGGDGVYVDSAGSPTAQNSDVAHSNGFEVAGAQGNGLWVGRSDLHGVLVASAGADGVHISSAGDEGVWIGSAVTDGVFVGSAGGYAGYFGGNVRVNGNLSKSSGGFQIDHPLDPENMYLNHSFVESPDMMNVYNGNVTTDVAGYATVELPDYFETLNRDFRYQLTVIGTFSQAIIAQEVEDNQFVIKTDKPNIKVSWQVTGIRQDPWAEANRLVVEEEKPVDEQNTYLHPEVYGLPVSQGLAYLKTQEGAIQGPQEDW